VANNIFGDELKRTVATINASPVMKDRVRVVTGSTFRTWDRDGRRRGGAARADVAAGAVGIGEIPKDSAKRSARRNGSRLALDDPELDPIGTALASSFRFIHTGDPQEFYQKVDYNMSAGSSSSFPGTSRRSCPASESTS